MNGRVSVDLGQLFTVPNHVLDGVTTVSQRDALAVVELKDAGVVNFNGPFLQRVVNGMVYSEAQTRSGPIAVYVSPADSDTQVIPGGGDGLPVRRVGLRAYHT